MRLTELKGIGEKTEETFLRAGVHNSRELLMYFPRTYDFFKPPILINDIEEEGMCAIFVSIFSDVEQKTMRKLVIDTVFAVDERGTRIKLVWFNMAFLKNKLKRGFKYVVRGEVKYQKGIYVMEQPALYTYGEYELKLNSLQPIYPLVKGLTNNMVLKAVKQCFEITDEINSLEYIPEDMLDRFNIMPIKEAIKSIHFPKNTEEMLSARKRLVFDEFFTFMIRMSELKNTRAYIKNDFDIDNHTETDELIKNLPFKLTEPQFQAYQDIMKDLSSDKMMNRLVQGDVGSGKTIIATLALMNTCLSGYQAAMMAPTEVLARQHYESLTKLFADNHIPINVVLLIGSLSAAQKRNIRAEIESGEANLILGTNALIQEKVQYNNLALVITDEQHRFGVNQREAIISKGELPNVLVMSATPIPRTLAMILYGDLDISVVNVMPEGRLPIKNAVVDESYRPKAYKFIDDQVRLGHQAYVICPMVSIGETSEDENVEEYTGKLREALPNLHIEGLHGQMKAEMKEDIMGRFSGGLIDVLVSTTVIEVGINVPNATVMLIENAQKFGLAQLHQLRGRVGRGSSQSYCIFINTSKKEDAKQRLAVIGGSNDGFYIAEEDLKLRGPGEFFGLRQSGEMSFKIADIYNDADVLKMAKEVSEYVYDSGRIEELKNCFHKEGNICYYTL